MQKRNGIKTQMLRVKIVPEGICREYAGSGDRRGKNQEKTDWNKEREKMKEMLLRFVKEAVKKQLKEEREYYKSRPSLAARQAESIFGAGNLENLVARGVVGRVYGQIEERIRREWIRKGEG